MDYHQTHHARSTRLFQTTALVAAAFAGVGVTIGLHDVGAHDGWMLPVLTGAAISVLFGTAWHVLIGFGARVRRREAVFAVSAAGVMLTAMTLGASALSIAAAVAGNGATQAVLASRVDAFAETLDEAHRQALTFSPLIETASIASAAYTSMAKQEAEGKLGAKSGCGPRCVEMQSFAATYGQAQVALTALRGEADGYRDTGAAAIVGLRTAAAAGDQQAFMRSTVDLGAAVSDLNGINPTPITSTTGVVVVDTAQDVSLDAQTASFHTQAETLLAARQTVTPPAFVPFSVFDAVRWEAFGAALHGVIVAASVDLLPLLALMIVMLTANEPLLRDAPRMRKRKPTEAERNASIRSEEDEASVGSYLHVVAAE
jgi:hypothetical protein